jgi:hypothetical protein
MSFFHCCCDQDGKISEEVPPEQSPWTKNLWEASILGKGLGGKALGVKILVWSRCWGYYLAVPRRALVLRK